MVEGAGEETASTHGRTVFISYASQDAAVATAVVASLESAGLACWIAPRDVIVIETNGALQGLQMLAAGRIEYAFANLTSGMWNVAAMRLSGKIEPLLPSGVVDGGQYVCFSKRRIAPSFVAAFSYALKRFKHTQALKAIYQKYFLELPPAARPLSGN
jgi:ABC-type amino acid transport substrate-binding protein